MIARKRGYSSVNRLVNSMAEIIIAQEDAEASFRAAASKGDPARLIALLDKLDESDRKNGIANTQA